MFNADDKSSALYRTVVLTLLAGIAVVAVAFANRNVYTKEAVDLKFHEVHAVAAQAEYLNVQRNSDICRRLGLLEEDVRWIVRNMGGIPSADARPDSSAP